LKLLIYIRFKNLKQMLKSATTQVQSKKRSFT